ncbi:MAG: choice-of-anchor J domain-containing protein [Bacteroidaceae bacterium]|nr:choice-of-anchor J domain-containing protein [Bacteroidaceae bacterium]
MKSIAKTISKKVVAMLLPLLFCASQAIATDYISDVVLVGGTKQETNTLIDSYKSKGWTLVEKDLNAGAGGDYIYLLYKKESSEGINRGYITHFYIKKGTWPFPDDIKVQDIDFHLVSYKGGDHFRGQRGDLNSNTGDDSDPIHLYYTRAFFSDQQVVTDITFNSNKSGALGANATSAPYDLNAGAGGDYIYMHVSKQKGIPDLVGEGTVTSPHIIWNEDDWHVFATDVKNGRKADKIVALAEDIKVTEMVGTKNQPFTGEFYGLGHELDLAIVSTEDGAAPFRYVKGAVIHGVKTKGTVFRALTNTGNGHAGGLVGFCVGDSTTIEDCVVRTNVTGLHYLGGIVGHAGSGKLALRKCSFNGTLGSYMDFAGGLVGWCDEGSLSLYSCMTDCTINPGLNGKFHPIACKWDGGKATATFEDVFYLNTLTQNVPDQNLLPEVEAQLVNASRVENQWDDPFTAADGTTYFAAHQASPKIMPYKFRFENSLCDWTVSALQSGSGLIEEDSYEGKSCFVFRASDHDQYLITPELKCRANEKVVFHFHGTKGVAVKFQIGTSTTTNDPSVFKWSDEYTALAGSWSDIVVITSGKIKYIAIKSVSGASDFYVDYFTMEEFGIYDPENVTTTDIAKDAASLQWNGNSDSYTVRYRPQPYFLETFDGDKINWRVHNEGGNSQTNWKVTYFNDGTYLHAHSGQRLAFGRSYDYSGQTAYKVDNWLISPQVELGGVLSYWLMDDGNKHEHYEIWVSTTVCELSAFQKVAEPGHGTLQYQWEEKTVDLSQFQGQKGYIAFRLTDEGKDFLAIDDVALYDNDWVTLTTNEPNVVLNNLAPGTAYDVQVQGAKDGKTTDWSSVYTFTTVPLSQEEIDGISSISISPANQNDVWYDLNGRRINEQPRKSGLYIHNGKKILRR